MPGSASVAEYVTAPPADPPTTSTAVKPYRGLSVMSVVVIPAASRPMFTSICPSRTNSRSPGVSPCRTFVSISIALGSSMLSDASTLTPSE